MVRQAVYRSLGMGAVLDYATTGTPVGECRKLLGVSIEDALVGYQLAHMQLLKIGLEWTASESRRWGRGCE